jgi:hypothetical protein
MRCDKIGKPGVITQDTEYYSSFALVVARSTALDLRLDVFPLLPGRDDLCMLGELESLKARKHSCDVRGRVFFWEDGHVLRFVTADDGFSSLGRPGWFDLGISVLAIDQATEMGRDKGNRFEHWGTVPFLGLQPRNLCWGKVIGYVDRYGRLRDGGNAAVSPEANVVYSSCPARPVLNGVVVGFLNGATLAGQDGSVKMWLIATGCGHELIGKQEVASSGGITTPATTGLAFSTANGRTAAVEQANYHCSELNEGVSAYVLDSPPCRSVGGRTVHEEGF